MNIGNMIPLLAFILIASVSEVFSLERKVVVLSFDGFRADYYNKNLTPKLDLVRNISASPKFLETIFPPKTTATLHTLATGVYPDVHGVYSNEMFDGAGGIKKYKDNHFDDENRDIVPIWTENQTKGNGKSGIMMWPGGEFQYQGNTPSKVQSYKESMPWTERANTIVQWTNEGCNLVMAYFEDYPCYNKNQLADHIKDHAKKVDDTIEDIRTKLSSDFDLVILSDHGVSTVPGSNVLKIESIITESSILKIVSGPLVFLKIPDESKRNTLYSNLRSMSDKFKAYIQSDFQSDWYIKSLTVLNDVILLVAEPTYTFMKEEKFNKLLSSNNVDQNNFVTLENGYDNDEKDMNAFFVGIGPGFKDNVFLEEHLDLIDVYPILKALLKLKGNACSVQTKNSLSNVAKKLLEPAVISTYENL